MQRFKGWLENQEELIGNLQPNTIITVYHGSTMQDTYNFVTAGVDARTPTRYRVYPHWSGNKPLKFGIFVAPNPKVSFQFGRYVIEFDVMGKDLISRFPVEMKDHDKFYKKINKHPNSFRPTVTDDLLNLNVEPQALFVGLLAPNKIKRVWALKDNRWDQIYSMTPEEFIAIAKTQKVKDNSSIFSPEEYNLSLKDFVHRLAQEHNSTDQEILETLVWVYKRDKYLHGIGNVPYSLLRRIEKQLDKYIKNLPPDQ